MFTADFSVCCEGKGCTATFSDGMNRPVERVHDLWIVARLSGWREVGQRDNTKHLCPECAAKFMEAGRRKIYEHRIA